MFVSTTMCSFPQVAAFTHPDPAFFFAGLSWRRDRVGRADGSGDRFRLCLLGSVRHSREVADETADLFDELGTGVGQGLTRTGAPCVSLRLALRIRLLLLSTSACMSIVRIARVNADSSPGTSNLYHDSRTTEDYLGTRSICPRK
jgi:hypothetical protein